MELARSDDVTASSSIKFDELSGQGSLSLKASWASASVILTTEMHAKFKGKSQTYSQHQFSLWLAHNPGKAGLMGGFMGGFIGEPGWKSYRLTYIDKKAGKHVEVGYTILGLEDERDHPERFEFAMNTLDATTHPCHVSMRCATMKDYTDWKDLLKEMEDPKLANSALGKSSGGPGGRPG